MFDKLIAKLKSLADTNKLVFDPSKLNDPLATQIQWTPAKGGGASFRTHKIVMKDPNRLEFKATFGAIAFDFVFILMGLGAAIAFSSSYWSLRETPFELTMIIPILGGLIFVAVGGLMMYFGTKPIVFDKYKSCFWKGRKSPDEVADKKEIKYFSEFDNIHALQIVSEYCSGKNSFYSYELNLVLKNGSRINVVDHGNWAKLREDAKTLSTFLGKPLWDSTSVMDGSSPI